MRIKEFISLITGHNAEKMMADKADKIRKALVEGASPRKITERVIERCRRDHGDKWSYAAIAQVAEILQCGILAARALVSEMSTEKTTN